MVLLKKNVRRHVERNHSHKPRHQGILPSMLVDPKAGVYLVQKAKHGNPHPVHVTYMTAGSAHCVSCSSDICRDAASVAGRSHFSSFQCMHVASIHKADPFVEPVLGEQSLESLVELKLTGKGSKEELLKHKRNADGEGRPLVTYWEPSKESTFAYFSIFTGQEAWYSRMERLVVRVNKNSGVLYCCCPGKKGFCVHKKIAFWHILGNNKDLFSSMEKTACSSKDHLEATSSHSTSSSSPPSPSSPSLHLASTPGYHRKAIPVDVPVISVPATLTELVPQETKCVECGHSLKTNPHSRSAKVYDMDKIISGEQKSS